MSISNSREFLEDLVASGDYVVTEHLVAGQNVQLVPGTYPPPNWDDYPYTVDSVTFTGTAGRDALFGGGGEAFAFFKGTRGDDLYGVGPSPDVFVSAYVDYSKARTGVLVDMTYHGSRTFTDAGGDTRTVNVVGKAHDGFGGTDYFAESAEDWNAGYSSIVGVFGSSHRDVMIEGGSWDFYGGGGNDLMIGGFSHGGTGNDKLVGRSVDGSSVVLFGDEGNDTIFGTDGPGRTDVYLVGGAGHDRIFAGAGDDTYLTGDAGNDYIDAGAGNDFMDGGVGRDVLVSGSGNDIINPDVEFFQLDPTQARDGVRDVIKVTRDDLGDFNDVVLSRAFEAGRDQIRFADAVRGGADFRVYQEDLSINPDTGRLFRSDDQAGLINTVLQIDQNGNGLGDAASPDTGDYFLFVLDADLSLRDGFVLT